MPLQDDETTVTSQKRLSRSRRLLEPRSSAIPDGSKFPGCGVMIGKERGRSSGMLCQTIAVSPSASTERPFPAGRQDSGYQHVHTLAGPSSRPRAPTSDGVRKLSQSSLPPGRTGRRVLGHGRRHHARFARAIRSLHAVPCGHATATHGPAPARKTRHAPASNRPPRMAAGAGGFTSTRAKCPLIAVERPAAAHGRQVVTSLVEFLNIRQLSACRSGVEDVTGGLRQCEQTAAVARRSLADSRQWQFRIPKRPSLPVSVHFALGMTALMPFSLPTSQE